MQRFTEKKAAAAFNQVQRNYYTNNQYKPQIAFLNAWTDENGQGIVCDGFRIYKLFAGIPSEVEHIKTAETENASSENWKKAEETRKKVLDITINQAFEEDYTLIDTPTEEIIKEHFEKIRSNKRVTWIDNNGSRVYFDSLYLKQLITLFPAGNYYMNKKAGSRSSILVLDDNGQGFLLPVRIF